MAKDGGFVMVVDDDADLINLLRRVLRAHDATIELRTASSLGIGQEGLSSERPRLVIVSEQLPGAFELGEWMRRQESLVDVPLLVSTGGSDPRLPERAGAAGAREVLYLPVDTDEVSTLFADALRRYLGEP